MAELSGGRGSAARGVGSNHALSAVQAEGVALKDEQGFCTPLVKASFLAAALGCVPACAGSGSITAPTPRSSVDVVQLTVRVLEYHTELPIPSAIVYVDNRPVGRTSDDGVLMVSAERGQEVTMSAHADGYQWSLTAAGTPLNAERWTFYLERDGG